MTSIVPPLIARDGPLTQELLLAPANFGLGMAPAGLQADAIASSICGFCSTGCNLNIHLRDHEAVGLTPEATYPVNLGMACPKGWESLAVLDAPDRATSPLARDARGALRPISWDVALSTFVTRMKAIQAAHGPHSVAFISTGQIVTEEMALLGALAKFGMGMLHGDGNTRQCMATSVVAYKQAFGFDAPPYTYADFEESDVIILIGSNLCIAHPILWQRVMRNPHEPEIVVIDPRGSETAMAATQHLPVYPKSDLALLYGVARLLIERDWIDRDFIAAHTSGFEEFAAFVADFTLDRVADETRLPAEAVERLAATIHQGQRVSFWWTMGVNQSHQATRTAQAIVNLALMTGNIGRPGTGANSITGQCNAMGSRLFSNTTNLLGGHDFASADHRRKVAGVLDIDEAHIPREASWPYHRIIEGVLRGEIRGLWVVATNPAHSWINQNMIRDVLDRLNFLVVQDMYHSTETVQHAHLVLPAAGWGEKDGTFINSERRIGVTRKVRRAPGVALADFHIFKLIAESWGCGEMFRQWESPAAVFELLKQLSAGQPCDITGIDGYDMLVERGGVQWPLPSGSVPHFSPLKSGTDPLLHTVSAPPRSVPTPSGTVPISRSPRSETGTDPLPQTVLSALTESGTDPLPQTVLDSAVNAPDDGQERRLFADGRFYHPDGRARFIYDAPSPLPEEPTKKQPFLLLTGRGSAAQWHTQTRTAKSAILQKISPQELHAEINPQDAARLAIRTGDLVRIASQRGDLTARALVTPSVQPGQVFLPMHDAATNRLTFAAFDPHSHQPAYKACAVSLERAERTP